MATGAAGTTPADGSGSTSGTSFLPWHLIPPFKPGETDVNEYTRRLEFLAGIWPAEHLPLLAPRACLLCEGSAFAKVVRLDPSKLKTPTTAGIQLVVATLGGVWGQSQLERKYERFERAIFGTIQKSDESNSSYLARHEVQYEDMINLGATLEEMRAYILLRNSALPSEDKKKLIIDAKGNLEYKKVVELLQLLGSRFFGEVQSGSKSQTRTKTYDVNYVDDDPQEIEEDEAVFFSQDTSEDSHMEQLLIDGDEDALVIAQFEEAILDSIQSDPDVAVCLNSYVEARRRLSEKTKGRGFWAPRPPKGKGFKGKGKGTFRNKFRKPLAQRIAESTCRLCLQPGHWKAECPQRGKTSMPSSTTGPPNAANAFAGMAVTVEKGNEDWINADVMETVPENAVAFTVEAWCPKTKSVNQHDTLGFPWKTSHQGKQVERLSVSQNSMKRQCQQLAECIRRIGRKTHDVTNHSRLDPLSQNPETDKKASEVIFFLSHGTSGIVDLGASMSVIGQTQFTALCRALPRQIKAKMREAPCAVSFRFGNNSSVLGKRAIFFPIGRFWIKIIVVPSETPFLIANSVFRSLGAVIDTELSQIFFRKLDRTVTMTLSERNLFSLDLIDLLTDSEKEQSVACTASVSGKQVEITQESNNHNPECAKSVISQQPVKNHVQLTNSTTNPKLNTASRLESSQPPNLDSVDHVVHAERDGVRSIGHSPAPSEPGLRQSTGARTDHDDEQGRSERMHHGLRQGTHGQEVQRHAPRAQVPDVVCRDISSQSQTLPREASQVHPVARRGHGEEAVYAAEIPSQEADQPSKGEVIAVTIGDSSRDAGHSRSRRHGGDVERHPREWSQHTGDDGNARSSALSRECHAADPGPSEELDSESGRRAVDSSSKHLIADICAACQNMIDPKDIHDPMLYGEMTEQSIQLTRTTNWVAVEMWQFLKKHGVHNPQTISHNKSDLLEIYCSSDSQLTNVAQHQGLTAARHSLRDGDLATWQGRQKLYRRLLELLPRDIWLSPKCKAWCKWNVFNSMKNNETAAKIMQDRESERVHLLLCDAIFQFQTWRSSQSHAHLEQPVGSLMVFQEELHAVSQQTYRAQCDMCTAGQLKHPITHEYLKKATQILTTSRIMKEQLDRLHCQNQHEHTHIAGQVKLPGSGRVNLSQYTELYTRVFARKVVRCLQCSQQISESSHPSEAIFSSSTEADPEPKRRKLTGKQEPSEAYVHLDMEKKASQTLEEISQYVPKIGSRVYLEGPVVESIAKLYPEKIIRSVEICKGTDRMRRPPKGITKTNAPLRTSFGKSRRDLTLFMNHQWESWVSLHRPQLIRKSIPARLVVTVYGQNRHDSSHQESESSQRTACRREADHFDHSAEEPCSKRFRVTPQVPEVDGETKLTPENQQSSLEPAADEPVTSHATHGPKFQKLSSEQRQQLIRMHNNLGHPNATLLGNVLRDQNWPSEAIEGIKDMHCPSCYEHTKPKIARPGHLGEPRNFNDLVTMDAVQWTNPEGKQYLFYHVLDAGTNFHVAIPFVHRPTSLELSQQLMTYWFNWAGPPKMIMSDSAGEFCSDEFGQFLQRHDVQSRIIPAEAHWQLGKCERHGAIVQDMLTKMHLDNPIANQEQFEEALCQCMNAKNSLSRHKGYSPEILVLGKSRHTPVSLSSDDFGPADFLEDELQTGDQQDFHRQLSMRESARKAFISSDQDMKLRRAYLSRQRPSRIQPQMGQWVMFWRQGKGNVPGQWIGPARVVLSEGTAVIWITHMSLLYRCAPEQVRLLSEREATRIDAQQLQSSLEFPTHLGKGVFRYQDLITSQKVEADASLPPIVQPHYASPSPETAVETVQPASGSGTTNPSENIENQPDSEPSEPIPHLSTPSTPQHEEITPDQIPVPNSDDDDEALMVQQECDHWTIQDTQLIRHHVQPRFQMFCPTSVTDCPVPTEWIANTRDTAVYMSVDDQYSINDEWFGNIQAHRCLPTLWTGTTTFQLKSEHRTQCPTQEQYIQNCTTQAAVGYEIALNLTIDEISQYSQLSYPEQIASLAASAKKQRSEVKERNLTPADLALFQGAKQKEITSWLSTETVRRIARSQIPEDQILRSRWVLTWKPIDPSASNPISHFPNSQSHNTKINHPENSEQPSQFKPKARLVILGFEDPHIESLARDSPTLGKDSRSLIFQYAASAKHMITSFDIQTAFLRGSRQDGRILGMEPPEEMRSQMNLKPWECCELLKSAYGLVNAPLLWYEELKGALVRLGFVMSPLDPCLFVLPRKDGKSGVHGVVGIHVDDGLAAGDQVFKNAIAQLEQKYPFGSKQESDFIFTGIHVHQNWDGSIELDQTKYIEDISEIQIDRSRRQTPEVSVPEAERQALRGLVGSVQYAATNTRPDISAKLSLLQAKINSACIKDLMEANRLLSEVKNHKDVKITYKSIPLDDLRFISFSDASFANRANSQSQKGCLILAGSKQIGEWQASDVSPLMWYSRKIARVVGSTLASEAYALSGSVDLLSWIRIHWMWICNPTDAWKKPEACLQSIPPAYAVVDCKSLYDLIQKTTIPQCQEYRTTLEALIIKDRIREGIIAKWVHSAAQLADSLTKQMDCSTLRTFLARGTCIIHDVDEILKQRADKRARKMWQDQPMTNHSTSDTTDGELMGRHQSKSFFDQKKDS